MYNTPNNIWNDHLMVVFKIMHVTIIKINVWLKVSDLTLVVLYPC
jgi:hypothetical protein